MLNDTIVAISTSLGEGAIGIVRLSGKDVLGIAKKIFVPNKGSRKLKSHQMRYGRILSPDKNKVIDLVLINYMKAPKTYTREDILEINVHGGIIPVRRVLDIVLKCGARLADPGEFTKRAFLNGRIDLTQAEAVIDVIRAKTEASLKIAIDQLQGGLKKKVFEIRNLIVKLYAKVELQLDFSEEEIEEYSHEELAKEALSIKIRLEKLLKTFNSGKIYKEGIKVAIIGKPNVGKSSLLNELIGEKRAIVTQFPGTTRDTIEEVINLEGMPLQIIDTAGLRHTKCEIEKEGLKRTKKAIETADLILLMIDSSNVFDEEDKKIISDTKHKKKIWVINKIDLPPQLKVKELEIKNQSPVIKISALKRIGIEDLKKKIRELFLKGDISSKDDILITNFRHYKAIQKAANSIKEVINTIEKKLSLEFTSIDLKEALDSLGVMVGETVSEDILNEIFANYCIGK
ncbi:MAG: tRNA uridine-5-carboxymethylaminomethyl(34) synthesis GTPase MnmE [bacterium]|nr:tRNA uridine-5-carboxymethylaminomethyl(34) synthesis GTPase MnmE [bacterium]